MFFFHWKSVAAGWLDKGSGNTCNARRCSPGSRSEFYEPYWESKLREFSEHLLTWEYFHWALLDGANISSSSLGGKTKSLKKKQFRCFRKQATKLKAGKFTETQVGLFLINSRNILFWNMMSCSSHTPRVIDLVQERVGWIQWLILYRWDYFSPLMSVGFSILDSIAFCAVEYLTMLTF